MAAEGSAPAVSGFHDSTRRGPRRGGCCRQRAGPAEFSGRSLGIDALPLPVLDGDILARGARVVGPVAARVAAAHDDRAAVPAVGADRCGTVADGQPTAAPR